MNQAVGLCTDESSPIVELDKYCQKPLLDGHSFKAVDKDGNVVACLINGIEPVKEVVDTI